MQVVFDIDAPPVKAGGAFRAVNDQLFARTVGTLVEALTQINLDWLSTHENVPWLYESGVHYSDAETDERFCDIGSLLKCGAGDCEDLAAWRIAELRFGGERGAQAVVQVYPGEKHTLYHVLVMRGDGRLEDPSAILGMET